MSLGLEGKGEFPGVMADALLLDESEGYFLNGIQSHWPLERFG
jgi:hypothetical protein